MALMDVDAQIELVLWACRKGKLSRLDVTMDDFEKVWMPDDVKREYQAGNCVTRVDEPVWHEKLKSGAATVEFGKRSGVRMLRVYDKDAESCGKVPSVRWEMQLRNGAAQEFVTRCLERVGPRVAEFKDEALGREFAVEVVSLVDFRDRSVSVNSGHCPRLPAFSFLMRGAVKIRHREAERVYSISRAKAYLEKAMAPLMSAVVAGYGGDATVLLDMLRPGRERWQENNGRCCGKWG